MLSHAESFLLDTLDLPPLHQVLGSLCATWRCPWCLPCFYPKMQVLADKTFHFAFKTIIFSPPRPDEILIFCTRLNSQGKQSKKPVSGTKQEQNKSMGVLLKYIHLNTFNLTWV